MLEPIASSFTEGIDETSLVLGGVLFLVSLLMIQAIWAYRNGAFFGRGNSAPPPEVPDEDEADAGEEMVVCPECSEPTEAEYRYCRHCASDTGKSYIGSKGDDGSSSSGML
jgi:hypothetical protein